MPVQIAVHSPSTFSAPSWIEPAAYLIVSILSSCVIASAIFSSAVSISASPQTAAAIATVRSAMVTMRRISASS
ncbi:hypothetical protein [Actinopolymorpha pittospori]|uniref:Membrane protein n=1 Tax=Actinopolymorpha pittospori TaxID=648752 RepID=A0A927MUV3_9ACTN|nr:hypothetical protein [Actinopolymorpha pittospori]MBE1603732.1 putative membrane protein [Actinopolymorpha pittospori]